MTYLFKIINVCMFLLCSNVLANSRPNIVIFMADDLGIGDLGCYGNTTLKTPHIDSLAKDGAKLTQHLATASMCTPSRAAFLTERYQIRSGMAEHHAYRVTLWAASTAGLPSSEMTIAEQAKKAGYTTALIGKWHLGLHSSHFSRNHEHQPLNQGYDSWYGFPLTNFKDFGDEGDSTILSASPYLYSILAAVTVVLFISLYFLHKKEYVGKKLFIVLLSLGLVPVIHIYISVEYFKILNSFILRDKVVVEQPIRLKGLTNRLVTEGVEFLEARNKDQSPFLLHMSWVHVHTFLDPGRKFAGRTHHGRYGDCVEEMDWGTGQIIQALDRLGFRDNTLVYFTSDQGAHLEERGKRGEVDGGSNSIYKGGKSHGTVDGGIRVPGLIRWPEVVPAGTVVDTVTSLMDIFPLVSKATDTPIPEDRIIDGKDILPLLQGKEMSSPHEFLFHYCADRIHAVRYMPRNGNQVWKLAYRYPDYLPNRTVCRYACSCKKALVLDPPVLFDMTSDPGENNPIRIDSNPKFTEIAELVDKAVADHKKSMEPYNNQFILPKLLWNPGLQTCCNFPYCSCVDPKYPNPDTT